MNHDIITPNEQTRITQDSTVDLHFEVSLENGTVIDSTFERGEPVRLVVGDGSLLEGFEKVLINLTAGDTRTASPGRLKKHLVNGTLTTYRLLVMRSLR